MMFSWNGRSKPECAEEGAVDPRRGAEPVVFAEAADPCASPAARIAIDRAGIIAARLQRTLHPRDIRASGFARIVMTVAVNGVRRRNEQFHERRTRPRAGTDRPAPRTHRAGTERTARASGRRLCNGHGGH